MDIDRRREEAGDPNRKPRLIEESEIPITILNQSQKFTEDEEKLIAAASSDVVNVESLADVGRRKRKDVNYSQVEFTGFAVHNKLIQ